MRGQKGFTLLELLVALALVGALLAALNAFVFSMGELWGRGTADRLFRQHVHGATHFIETLLQRSSAVGSPAGEEGRVAWRQPPGTFGGQQLLTFEVAEAPALLPWPERPLPFVVLRLEVRSGEGLVLHWRSRLESDRLGRNEERCTVVSPFVTAISYDYYDEAFQRWTNQGAPRLGSGGEPEMPRRLRLVFEHEGRRQETAVALPVAGADGRWVF